MLIGTFTSSNPDTDSLAGVRWHFTIRQAEHSPNVKTIFTWRLSQLSLTNGEMAELLARLRRRGVDLIAVQDGFRLASPEGERLSRILGYGKSETSKRIRMGRAKKELAPT